MSVSRILKNNVIIIIDTNDYITWQSIECKNCNMGTLCGAITYFKTTSNTLQELLHPCIYFILNIKGLVIKVIIGNYYKLNLLL